MSDVIKHHGILGQKWGVRRFQNQDGSLTKAGKERYGVGNILSNISSANELRDANRKKVTDVTISANKKEGDKKNLGSFDVSRFLQGGNSYVSKGTELRSSTIVASRKHDYYTEMVNSYSKAVGSNRDRMLGDIFSAYKNTYSYRHDYESRVNSMPKASDTTSITKMLNAIAEDKAMEDMRKAEEEIFEEEKKEMEKILKMLGIKGADVALVDAADGTGHKQMKYVITSPYDGTKTYWTTNDIKKMSEYIDKENKKEAIKNGDVQKAQVDLAKQMIRDRKREEKMKSQQQNYKKELDKREKASKNIQRGESALKSIIKTIPMSQLELASMNKDFKKIYNKIYDDLETSYKDLIGHPKDIIGEKIVNKPKNKISASWSWK